jgi:hypothetical protein
MRDTIDMAREAGFELEDQYVDEWSCFTDEIGRFEALVRADEREACAKVCEERGWHVTAAAIRARGNT